MSYRVASKNVNSKILFKELTVFIDDVIDNFDIKPKNGVHISALVSLIEMGMEDYLQDGKITQYNVICDDRNNKSNTKVSGVVILEVTYKQKNCVNTTQLCYAIKDGSVSGLDKLLAIFLKP